MNPLPRSRPRTTPARIDGRDVSVQPGETLLQAALRAGVDVPNRCRVGGCGACRCRVTSGEVIEFTETGYLLNAEELDRNTVLACQSAPVGPVTVEIDRPDTTPGQVRSQERVTPDITRLEVQLDRPIAYRAGQFVPVRIDGLPGVTRSYSFASPPRADGVASFFIRHVPGGQLSGLVHETDLVGRRVALGAPSGGFTLRAGRAPLLFIAGGSGLAPILAMLEAGAEAGVDRPAVLLFGARTQRDLYAQAELADLVERWKGGLTVIPVLSRAADDPDWRGARGRVTDHVADHVAPGAHAYLCGSPGLVDAVDARLRASGVPAAHIHADRFTTQADAAPAASRPVAGIWDYAKYGLFHVLGLVSVLSLLGGGATITAGLVTVVGLYVLGDAFGGDDTATPRHAYPQILTGLLWAALPLMALIAFVSVWTVCDTDPLGFGAGLSALTGTDLLAARANTGLGHRISGLALTILANGLVSLIAGHELVHRTWNRWSLQIGRLLYAFAFDANFSIEHVYGHHRYAATAHDPATAPRGRSVYAHVVASTVKGNRSSWRIERARLERRRLPLLSWHNAVLRGHLLNLSLVGVAWAMGGALAAAYYLAIALGGKAILEMVNYMEHYGLVRDPDEPVAPRHSWNTNRRLSSWAMFNLTRHSHHHAQGEVPFYDLRPFPEAPLMVNGYLTTMFLTMVPPLWHHLMTPKVQQWDATHASLAERRLAAEANARSGLPALMAADRLPRAMEAAEPT